jgi:hypothetical protein
MDDFLLNCCFNAVYEGQKFRKSTLRYANWLRGMPHSAESGLCAICALKNSSTARCYAPQREIQYKIFWSTLRYAAQRGVDSVICGIAQSCDSPLCGIARSQHKFVLSHRNRNQIQKYFRMIISDLGRLDWWKKPGVKNLLRLSL